MTTKLLSGEIKQINDFFAEIHKEICVAQELTKPKVTIYRKYNPFSIEIHKVESTMLGKGYFWYLKVELCNYIIKEDISLSLDEILAEAVDLENQRQTLNAFFKEFSCE